VRAAALIKNLYDSKWLKIFPDLMDHYNLKNKKTPEKFIAPFS